MSSALPRGIIGGKAHCEVAAIALQLTMAVEESKSGINPFETYILTTDFSKFFDSLLASTWASLPGFALSTEII
jgi:hypothetical protein